MKQLILPAFLMMAAQPALAVDVTEEMIVYAQEQMRQIAQNPSLIDAIRAQNTKTETLSEVQILQLDRAWRAENASWPRPMIKAILSNPVSIRLANLAQNSGGRLCEVFVMDARGLNVGQSTITSDYWQGDEAKFTETYPKGSDAMHVSEIELDESTQAYEGQVSFTVKDPDSGEIIGAVTFGIDASQFL